MRIGVAITIAATAWFSAATLAASQRESVEIRCQPVILPPCENALKMRLERGSVPNRCNVT